MCGDWVFVKCVRIVDRVDTSGSGVVYACGVWWAWRECGRERVVKCVHIVDMVALGWASVIRVRVAVWP